MLPNRRLFRVGFVILTAFAALLAGVWWVQAQGVATVRIMPVSRDVDPQTTYTLTLTVEDAEDLGGFEFDLAYDPALMRVDDVALGGFLGSTGRSSAELGPDIDNTAGVVTYGAFSFGSQAGPDGTGSLAIVSFTTTISEGIGMLALQNVQLINTAAHTQSVQVVGGSITVLAGPRIGTPGFSGSVPSDESLTVTAFITNTTSDTGVSSATLRYGATSPYTQASAPGSGPGGNGDGLWSFTLPSQGDAQEGQTLRFSLEAQDGDVPAGVAVDDNIGSYYGVTIIDDDTAPPVFSNPAPATVISVFSITLQVDVADAQSGIADNDAPTESVYVEWDTDGEFATDAFRADMDWVSGTTYAIDLPIAPLTAGITVTWRVYAADDDNSPSGGWSAVYETQVIAPLFGDLDYDCDVDIDDIMIVASRWNSVLGDLNYDSRYDFDSDGDIDVLDVMKVAAVWGSTCGGATKVFRADLDTFDQPGVDVSFTPSTAVVEVGTPFSMTVTIGQATDLGGFEFDLLFDPAAITITQVTLGDFLGSTGNTVASVGPDLTEDGRLVFGAFSYGGYEGASGQSDLATLELTLLSDTETVLRLEDVQLVTTGAEQVLVGTVGEGRILTGRGQYVVHLPLVLRSYGTP